MGTDCLMTYLTWDKKRKLNFAAGHKYIDGLKAEENGKIVDEEGNEHDRENIHGYLKDIEEAANDRHCEVASFQIGHLYIMVTGGVSWGDSPSGLYDVIGAINNIDFEIFTTVGFDLPEDLLDYKSILQKIVKTKEIRPLLLGLDNNLDKILEKEMSHGKEKKARA